MKILHIAINWNRQRQFALERMLKSISGEKDYLQFDFLHHIKRSGISGMNRELVRVSRDFCPDVTFMQHANDVTNETLVQIPGKVFSWNGDARDELPDHVMKQAQVITCTLYSNMRDVELLRQRGFNADYLQIGFDEEIYQPKRSKKPYDVVFQGNNYNLFELSEFRLRCIEELKREFNTIVIGTNWPKGIAVSDSNYNAGKEANFYHLSKIGLNISNCHLPRYSSDRIFRIMASGCFCLAHYYEGIELEFTPDVNLVTFTTPEEMMDKARFYLQNESEREKIAKAGCEWVHHNHRWIDRAKDFKGLIEKYA